MMNTKDKKEKEADMLPDVESAKEAKEIKGKDLQLSGVHRL